jgi:hypothetical protein
VKQFRGCNRIISLKGEFAASLFLGFNYEGIYLHDLSSFVPIVIVMITQSKRICQHLELMVMNCMHKLLFAEMIRRLLNFQSIARTMLAFISEGQLEWKFKFRKKENWSRPFQVNNNKLHIAEIFRFSVHVTC